MRRVFWVLAVLGQTALRGLQASPVTSGVAVLTISTTLVLVGAFALLVTNMSGLLERFGEEIQVVAYLHPELDPNQVRELATRVATVEGVQKVEPISPEQAMDRLEESLGNAELLQGLEENPLPPSLEISLLPAHRSPQGLAIVVEALDGLPGVEELAHGHEWVESYSRALSLVRTASMGLAGVLGLAALLIVANTIRLAVYARDDELRILALVGASRTFVRVPFLIEGTLQGATGGLMALAVLYACYLLVLPELSYGLELFLGSSAPRFFGGSEAAMLIAGGAGLGSLGSVLALLGWRA